MKKISSIYPVLIMLFSFTACAEPEKDVEDETTIVDTGNIQDGTEVEKTLEIDTPVINNE